MNLKARLLQLETRAAPQEEETKSNAREKLDTRLRAVALRLAGTEFSEAWCASVSRFEVAAAAMHELDAGTSTPALWRKVASLAEQDGAVGKLFEALEAHHAA